MGHPEGCQLCMDVMRDDKNSLPPPHFLYFQPRGGRPATINTSIAFCPRTFKMPSKAGGGVIHPNTYCKVCSKKELESDHRFCKKSNNQSIGGRCNECSQGPVFCNDKYGIDQRTKRSKAHYEIMKKQGLEGDVRALLGRAVGSWDDAIADIPIKDLSWAKK